MPIKKELLYSGKAKSLYITDEPDYLIAEFRDDTTAFDGVKHEKLSHKGAVNNRINACLMKALNEKNVLTHFKLMSTSTESVVHRLRMLPLEHVVRNIAAGSLCRRLGIVSGIKLNPPLYELFLKNDELHDPLVNDYHAISFGWATAEQLKIMHRLALKINTIMTQVFDEVGLLLVDAKYEFGVDSKGEIRLGDEISPDSCRIWDKATNEPLDKDRFRQDLGGVVTSYERIAQRLSEKSK